MANIQHLFNVILIANGVVTIKCMFGKCPYFKEGFSYFKAIRPGATPSCLWMALFWLLVNATEIVHIFL